MGTVLEEGEGAELDARGRGRWCKTPRRGEGPKVGSLTEALIFI